MFPFLSFSIHLSMHWEWRGVLLNTYTPEITPTHAWNWFFFIVKRGHFKHLDCPTTADGSNDHFCVFEIWHKNQILSKTYNISPNVLVILGFGKLVKAVQSYNNIFVTLHNKINKIGQGIWSLLPFAMVFLKLAYIFCVQIVKKQLCLNIFFSNFCSFVV